VAEGDRKAFVIESLDGLTDAGSTLPRMQCKGCCSRRHPSRTGRQVTGRRDLVPIIVALERRVVHYSISFWCMEKSVRPA
jgi:hypothetical protein